MPRIVFLIYHGMGHFNACFKIAKILQSEYNIIFAGFESFKSYISVQGFPYYALRSVPFGKGFEAWVNKIAKRKPIYLNSLQDRIKDTLYYQREKELLTLLRECQPDIIFLDSLQATDFIILYPHLKANNVSVALIQTMLPSTLSTDCPPINSQILPGDKAGIKRSVARYLFKKQIRTFFSKIKYLGYDDTFLIRRRSKLNQIPEKYFNTQPSVHGLTFNLIPEFILSNLEFDFQENPTTRFQHYIGFMVEENRVEITELDYLHSISQVKTQRTQDKVPIIYCSFGTLKAKHARYAKAFINRLSDIAVKHHYTAIIAAQENDFVSKDIPGHVYFFKSVPQLEVLSMADVFITHGGFNSLKESIDAQVPMLLYLTESHADQKGCSSRVVFHQLGLRGDLKCDTEEDIHSKIHDLLHNPLYKERLREFKKADEKYTPEKFLSLVRQLTPLD